MCVEGKREGSVKRRERYKQSSGVMRAEKLGRNGGVMSSEVVVHYSSGPP